MNTPCLAEIIKNCHMKTAKEPLRPWHRTAISVRPTLVSMNSNYSFSQRSSHGARSTLFQVAGFAICFHGIEWKTKMTTRHWLWDGIFQLTWLILQSMVLGLLQSGVWEKQENHCHYLTRTITPSPNSSIFFSLAESSAVFLISLYFQDLWNPMFLSFQPPFSLFSPQCAQMPPSEQGFVICLIECSL